jgi:hypothetical protein
MTRRGAYTKDRTLPSLKIMAIQRVNLFAHVAQHDTLDGHGRRGDGSTPCYARNYAQGKTAQSAQIRASTFRAPPASQ